MIWEQPLYFSITIAIPLLLLLALGMWWWKQRTLRTLAHPKVIAALIPAQSRFKPALKIVIVCFAILCLSIAMVNPKIGTQLETVKREGVDIGCRRNIKKSMLAEDIAPNRIEKYKQLVGQIINSLVGDRVGIIGYAASAFPQVPITTDFASAKLFLSNMNTDMVSSQGTAITEAITLAQTYYNDEEQTNRVLVIISDGEDHGGQITEFAQTAAQQGIRIYTIGVGTTGGGPIPIKQNGILQYYKRDAQNQQVITKLQQQTLEAIANAGNGEYINGAQTQEVVDKITAILNGMNKKEFESKQFTDFKDQFQWLLGAALFFWVLDCFLLERKTAWLQKLNLFNEK